MKLDKNKPVWVYRNLRNNLYSVMQNGIVVARLNRLLLRDVVFKVREGGRQRVLWEGRKNVHAFAIGKLVKSAYGTDKDGKNLPVKITYNPYNAPSFIRLDNKKPISKARVVLLNECGVTAAYVDLFGF